MKPFLSLLFSLFLLNSICSQEFAILKGDFTLIEKTEINKENRLTIGSIDYNSINKTATFDIKFPEEQQWKLKDTLLSKYRNDSLISTISVGELNDNFVFNSILNYNVTNFGLDQYGFITSEVKEVDGSVQIFWTPPSNAKDFLKEAQTTIKNNLLQKVVFIDVDGIIMNETYYEKYEFVNSLPVPVHISSRFNAQNETLIKVLKMRNVSLE